MAVSTINRILRTSRTHQVGRTVNVAQTQRLNDVQKAISRNQQVKQIPKVNRVPARASSPAPRVNPTVSQAAQRVKNTVAAPVRQTVARVQRTVNPRRPAAVNQTRVATTVVRPAASNRVVQPVARQTQQATTAAGTRSSVLQRIRDNPLVSAVIGTGATVGGLLAYDAISQRMDVPDDVAALDAEYKQTVLQALEAILDGQNQVVMPDGQIIDTPAYDMWTNQVPLGDTGYTLGLPAAETGIDWIDAALDDGGALIYDEAGEPVAVMDENGSVTGLLDTEAEQIKKRDGINWPMWIAIGALALFGGYWIHRRRKVGLPVVNTPRRKSRSILV